MSKKYDDFLELVKNSLVDSQKGSSYSTIMTGTRCSVGDLKTALRTGVLGYIFSDDGELRFVWKGKDKARMATETEKERLGQLVDKLEATRILAPNLEEALKNYIGDVQGLSGEQKIFAMNGVAKICNNLERAIYADEATRYKRMTSQKSGDTVQSAIIDALRNGGRSAW